MQTELLDTRKWSTTLELTIAMADYIDNCYNVQRRLSYLGHVSPAAFPLISWRLDHRGKAKWRRRGASSIASSARE
ncbi:IS3 family transposase, partial [Nocardia sp. NPDC059239]|uniref:IS3 family transposase n=1 Tax=Nocardia sp. NPDC059239 TaxID=3346785 RepID=UPI0036CA8633